MAKDSEEREELKFPGIYFLFGNDDETGDPLIYIGETENVICRLKQHLAEWDYEQNQRKKTLNKKAFCRRIKETIGGFLYGRKKE